MALNINGRMKVKTLRTDFKKEFGLALRVYDGRSFADDDATLASIRKGDSKGGEFSPQRNTKLGNLEEKMLDMYGIKVQVAGSDDSYLCDNDLTLAGAFKADAKRMGKRAKRKVKNNNASVEDTDVSADDGTVNKVGVLCLDWHNDEIINISNEAPKLFIFGFFVDDTDYEEEPDEEAFYGLKAYAVTGDNGSGFYAGWLVDNYYFADEIDEMDDGQFPDDMLTKKYPEEMKKLRELVAKYSAFPEAVGGGFPEGCMLNEDDIDDPAEQPYLINNIEDEDNLVLQYFEKAGDIDLEGMPEDIFNLNFPFLVDESKDTSNTDDIPLKEIIEKIKVVYKDHEDLDEIVDDLEDNSYFDHWAEKFVTEDYGKNVALAKALFKFLEERTDSFDDFSDLASKVGDADVLGDKEWAKALFRKALTHEADRADDILDLAEKIADEKVFGDKEWAREIVKKALKEADGNDLRSIAVTIVTIFEDKEWAKEVYKEAIEKSDDASVLSYIGNDITNTFDDEKELCEKAYYKGIEKAEQDPYKFYMKFYIANGILEDVDREKGIEIGLSVIDDDRCDAETCIEVARSIARGDVEEFKEKEAIVYKKIIDGDSSDSIVQLLESYLHPEEHEDLFREAVEKVEALCTGVSVYCLADLGSAVSEAGETELAKRVYKAAMETSDGDDDEFVYIWNNTNLDDEEWMEEFKNELIEKCEEDWAKEEIGM